MSDLVLTMLEKAKAEIARLHTHLEHRSDANTQLRAEVERLTAALRSCAERFEAHGLDMPQIARAALEGSHDKRR